jgi:divalent anion:Na+ symporter, DASS family
LSAGRRRWAGIAALVLVYLFVVYVIPKPAAVKPEGWRLTGIFAAAIAGSILQPIPGAALVLMAVTLSALFGGLTIQQALAGYADPVVWLVMAAFFISRALINTGLARRIALFFVRLFGQSSLGISYALTLSDMVLATIIPSNGARSGGVILPIARSIAELYGSSPGPTAALLGTFLLTAVYQGICITTSMFFTGQASNSLMAQMAGQQFGYSVTWSSWALAGIVPGLCSIAIVPWVVLKLTKPEILRTPEAANFARRELHAMGPLSGNEKILGAVFLSVCALWITSGSHHIDVTVVALCGSVALLLTGVLKWEDVKAEQGAWDLFIWYGGLVRLGKALNDTGVTTEFAKGVGNRFSGLGWVALLAIALLIYFYSAYAYASITAHVLAMLPPFLAVLVAGGAPTGLVFYAFATFSNFAAGLTHYGTTPAPMFFANGYTPLKTWWRVGFIVSLVNITIWSTVGFTWWKLVGFW